MTCSLLLAGKRSVAVVSRAAFLGAADALAQARRFHVVVDVSERMVDAEADGAVARAVRRGAAAHHGFAARFLRAPVSAVKGVCELNYR